MITFAPAIAAIVVQETPPKPALWIDVGHVMVPVFASPWFSPESSPVMVKDPGLWTGGVNLSPMPEVYIACHPHHVAQMRFDLWCDRIEAEMRAEDKPCE